jgi:uncharacterized membrane protein YdjX (TVP38/TMEM64 family)
MFLHKNNMLIDFLRLKKKSKKIKKNQKRNSKKNFNFFFFFFLLRLSPATPEGRAKPPVGG